MNRNEDNAGVRFPPPFIYLGTLLIGMVAERFVALNSFGIDRVPLVALGMALAVLGMGLIVAALGLFRRAGTPPEPWSTTATVVSSGVYARTRNPMYLGMALVYAGLALALDAPVALILLLPLLLVIQMGVIAREERYLATKFGDVYLDYRRRVRRWM